MKNKKTSSKDDFAMEIASKFQEEHRIELYRYMIHKHDDFIVRRAFEEASKVPVDKIKKSKSALFFYLLNKYAEK